VNSHALIPENMQPKGPDARHNFDLTGDRFGALDARDDATLDELVGRLESEAPRGRANKACSNLVDWVLVSLCDRISANFVINRAALARDQLQRNLTHPDGPFVALQQSTRHPMEDRITLTNFSSL
jgi:hypothetical protein